MRKYIKILFAIWLLLSFRNVNAQGSEKAVCFDFYAGTFNSAIDSSFLIKTPQKLSEPDIQAFYHKIEPLRNQALIHDLLSYKKQHELNDWLYYQLIRKTAQQLSPKEDNYSSYTLYKWFLLSASGYDARLALSTDKVIFFVYNQEDIEDIPSYAIAGKNYMCLNIHDYPKADLTHEPAHPIAITVPGADGAFSYKVTRMPDFTPASYTEKELQFTYRQKAYRFKIKLNPQVATIFKNYPVVDFESYFNIPMSKETYGSLIPLLRKNVSRMNTVQGVDYLMHFTRYAFLYESDEMNYGKEKRLSPEETLFAQYSDCDDRAALFFYLVKEIYNLPMIAVLYPTHITMAVQFDKPIGTPVIYKGRTYSFCESTPQLKDLPIGQLSATLRTVPYHVVYQYTPDR